VAGDVRRQIARRERFRGQIVRCLFHPYARGLLDSTVHAANEGKRLENHSGERALARQGRQSK